ncbi:hypothetical protein PR048_011614 [Dryococelus australis]|uniref:Uncharacterized protein n=1 Tax=Dryococelus australis TaxID=614101 RepID=A0ABQ9HM76_9NEOP|nr:hypothetical protein PR048_011614 [Dryococelus australis]
MAGSEVEPMSSRNARVERFTAEPPRSVRHVLKNPAAWKETPRGDVCDRQRMAAVPTVSPGSGRGRTTHNNACLPPPPPPFFPIAHGGKTLSRARQLRSATRPPASHAPTPMLTCDSLPISTLASHQGEQGSMHGQVTRFSQVRIVPDDAVGRRFISGISCFPAPLFQRRSIFTSITLIGSQDLAVKSRPNPSTHIIPEAKTSRPCRSTCIPWKFRWGQGVKGYDFHSVLRSGATRLTHTWEVLLQYRYVRKIFSPLAAENNSTLNSALDHLVLDTCVDTIDRGNRKPPYVILLSAKEADMQHDGNLFPSGLLVAAVSLPSLTTGAVGGKWLYGASKEVCLRLTVPTLEVWVLRLDSVAKPLPQMLQWKGRFLARSTCASWFLRCCCRLDSWMKALPHSAYLPPEDSENNDQGGVSESSSKLNGSSTSCQEVFAFGSSNTSGWTMVLSGSRLADMRN